MNEKDTIKEILFYHLDIDEEDGEKYYSLLRAVMYKNREGYYKGEVYYNSEWHPSKAALTYYPDPTPGEFIDEARAREIMKIIDHEMI